MQVRRSVDSTVKDISSVYSLFYDHTGFTESEIRSFQYEFELKRGDIDLQALKKCISLLQEAHTHLTEAKGNIDTETDNVTARVRDISSLLSTCLSRERSFNEERDRVRAVDEDRLAQERSNILQQQLEIRGNIEKESEEQLLSLQRKYGINLK